MTNDDIRRHIELMRAIDKPTVHLPLETVERLMGKAWRGSNNLRHGHTRFGRNTPTYSSYRSMINRCENENVERFKHYGGKGIHVCDRWKGDKGFENFLSDMGDKPDGMSLDRLDTSKGYCRENCRWATNKEQANNRTTNVWVEVEGQNITLKEAADMYAVSYKRLWKYVRVKHMSLTGAVNRCKRP